MSVAYYRSLLVDSFFLLVGLLFIFLYFTLIATVWSSNPVNMVLLLILSFISAFFILLLVGLEFLATIFLLIYAGAISILFMFVIMMINLKTYLLAEEVYYINYFFILFVVIGVVLLLVGVAKEVFRDFYVFDWINILYYSAELEYIGYCVYNYFFFHLFLLTYILLVAMIGAIAMVFTVNIETRGQYNLKLRKEIGKELFLKSN